MMICPPCGYSAVRREGFPSRLPCLGAMPVDGSGGMRSLPLIAKGKTQPGV